MVLPQRTEQKKNSDTRYRYISLALYLSVSLNPTSFIRSFISRCVSIWTFYDSVILKILYDRWELYQSKERRREREKKSERQPTISFFFSYFSFHEHQKQTLTVSISTKFTPNSFAKFQTVSFVEYLKKKIRFAYNCKK